VGGGGRGSAGKLVSGLTGRGFCKPGGGAALLLLLGLVDRPGGDGLILPETAADALLLFVASTVGCFLVATGGGLILGRPVDQALPDEEGGAAAAAVGGGGGVDGVVEGAILMMEGKGGG
jgi:hypothetical protein